MRKPFVFFWIAAGIFTGYVIGRFSVSSVSEPGEASMNAVSNKQVSPGRLQGLTQADESKTREENQLKTVSQLTALGYLSGYEPASDKVGVISYNPEKACNGFNLITSAHAPEALLLDMTGSIKHKWRYSFNDAFPGGMVTKRTLPTHSWRRVHLLPDGDLLAIFNGRGLIKLTKNSELIWAVPGGFHHDLDMTSLDTIMALLQESRIIPEIHPAKPVLEEFICELDSNGREIRRVSILELFEKSDFAPLLKQMPDHGDILHANTLEVMDGSYETISPLFARGNILISLRHLDTIAILNLAKNTVLWAQSGQWHQQHEPSLVPEGHILLFDNQGLGDKSRVIEFDPFTREIVWRYQGSEANGFFSSTSGSCRRLSNDNIIITQSNSGRVFEVDRAKTIVWEYINPARTGVNNELIATLYDVVRVPLRSVSEWLH